jgi:hypothetical protein
MAMNKRLVTLTIATTVASLLSFISTVAQVLPAASKAARVEITNGPELE